MAPGNEHLRVKLRPCGLVFSGREVSTLALRVFAAILLALGCLLVVWPCNHYVTRVTVLGFGKMLPGQQPASGQEPNSLEVMLHQWSRRALALTGTFKGRSYRKHINFGC